MEVTGAAGDGLMDHCFFFPSLRQLRAIFFTPEKVQSHLSSGCQLDNSPDPNFPHSLASLLKINHLSAHLLCFEVCFLKEAR